jgi:hypothetical protein
MFMIKRNECLLKLVFGMHQLVMNYYEFHKQIKHVIQFALLEMER